MSQTDQLIEITKQARALGEGDLKLRDIVERVLSKQPAPTASSSSPTSRRSCIRSPR